MIVTFINSKFKLHLKMAGKMKRQFSFLMVHFIEEK